jgi:hypothetical protein
MTPISMFRQAHACCQCLLLALALWWPHQASAFESDEHRVMSDLALAVARSMVNAQMPAGERLQEVDAAMAGLQGHYGTITACVDYFLTPEKILALPWASGTPAYASPDALPELGRYSLEQLQSRCASWSLRLMQASHSNHSHFQHDLMMALRAWHQEAVAVSHPPPGSKGNVFAGLFINAMSDHYLQDYFAPGHIVTPRESMTDLQATAMHDLANKMGVEFVPAVQAAPALREVLLYLCPSLAASPDTATCDAPQGVPPDLLAAAGMDKRAAAIRTLLAPEPAPIKFKGDGQLMGDSQLAQRLLLLAVQVRAILDVVDGQNHLQTMAFSFDRGQGKPDASMYFGHYTFEREGKQVISPVALSDQPVASSKGIVWPKLPICSFGQCTDKLYPLRSSSPVFSLSDQRESQSKGAYPGRSVYMLEMAWAGTLIDLSKWPGGFLSAVQMTPSFGYAWYEQYKEHGWGPSLRLSFAVPETEASVGPYIRRLSYTDQGQRVSRTGFGVQAEGGFSSYLTFFLLLGRDQSTDVNGRLQSGRMWGGGLRISSPLTRLSLFD